LIRAAVGALGSAAAAAQAFPALAPVVPGVGPALGIVHRHAEVDGVALTFDDGPHPEGTTRTLEVLRQAGASATFFLVGEQVARRPALAAEIVAAGHRAALHCHRHRNLLRLTPRQFREDIDRARAVIEDAAGQEIAIHRPPYGVFSSTALLEIRRRRLRPVLWSKWGKDWRRRATARSIAERSTDGIDAGYIVLLHDSDSYSAPGSWERTVSALPMILETLAERGLKPVPLDS
jgi:peptidoglycan/xylan/chitin deacetylase (PgdA/CDA1 family)